MKIVRVKTEYESGFEFDYSEGEGILFSVLAIVITFALVGCGIGICCHFFG